MSGQPTPPRIIEAFAKNAPTCNPSAPIAGGKTAPFPATSQIGIIDGAASLVDGFVPLNMTDPTSGGIPPFGVDMNGILFVVSSWAAFLGAGQAPQYDATLQTAMGGYSKGSRLSKAADPSQFWISAVDANMTDPDTGGANWISSVPLYATSAPTAGTHNDVVLPGISDYVLDVDVSAGNINFSGMVAQRDGQRVAISAVNAANLLQFLALNVGSAAANRFRAPADLAAVQNQTYVWQYSAGASLWILV